MINRINLSLLAFFIIHVAFGQKDIPTTWVSMPSKTDVKSGEIIELIFQADITEGWYLYSSDFDPDLGPVVATFSFTPNDSYELVGEIEPIGSKSREDKLIWMGTYTYFTKIAEFRQKVKILKSNPEIKAKINAQVCSDESGKCIPILQQFNFTGITLSAVEPTPEPVKKNETKKVSPQKTSPTGKTTSPQKNVSISKAEKTYSSKLEELRAEKELLILQSADGKDLVIEELEAFVKKYSKN